MRRSAISSMRVSAMISSTPSGRGYSAATIEISSRTDGSRINGDGLQHRADARLPWSASSGEPPKR